MLSLFYVSLPAVKMSVGVGLDTLEEEEEKARFFARLEAGASSTIDYSKLNKDLDSTSSTIGTNIRYGNSLSVIVTLPPIRRLRNTKTRTRSLQGS